MTPLEVQLIKNVIQLKSNHVVQFRSNRVVLVRQVNVLPRCVITIVVEGENLLEKKKNMVTST